ncbi:YdcF family protein [Herbiconiux sp. YIM B11900]|uniref:YdcF family protein n=1 Tax=Herbiconiux sp. YIM B11900 TaxID=3404131 RepID=UPI003F830220
MVAAVTAVVVLAAAIGAARIIVFPDLDDPVRADAVLVLGPPTVQRLVKAQSLVDDGLADEIIISVPTGFKDDDKHTRVRDLCLHRTEYEVTCFTPDPFTTQGEARLTAGLLRDHSWDSVIVVTSVTHVSRARLLFDRCVEPSEHLVQFVSDERAYDLRRWIDELVYQSAAWVKALATPGC